MEKNKQEGFLDVYSRNARLKVALLVILPLSGVVGAIGLNFSVAMGAVASPLSAVGFTLLLAQLGGTLEARNSPIFTSCGEVSRAQRSFAIVMAV